MLAAPAYAAGAPAYTSYGDSDPDPDDDTALASSLSLVPLDALPHQLRSHRLLSAQEERELARRYREERDEGARDTLITHNLRLVYSLALRFSHRHHLTCLTVDDLAQEGTMGLMHAIELFDERTGNKLSTYATAWIRQAIGRAMGDQDPMIAVPAHVREVATQRRHTRARLEVELGREASDREVRLATPPNANSRRRSRVSVGGVGGVGGIGTPKVPNEAFQVAAAAARMVDSLDTTIAHDVEVTLADMLADPDPMVDGDAVAERIAEADARARLWRACCGLLTERERDVLALRCGISGPRGEADVEGVGDVRDVLAHAHVTRRPLGKVAAREMGGQGIGWLSGELHTLEEVGRALHITRERVRQIEGDALRKLRVGLTLDAGGSGAVTVKARAKGAAKAKTKAAAAAAKRAKGGAATHDHDGTFAARIAALLDADPSLPIATLAAHAGVSHDTAWRHARAWHTTRAQTMAAREMATTGPATAAQTGAA